MRILPYYILHTFINSIKKLFKTWVAIFIAVCLGFGLIGGIVGVTIGSIVEDSAIEETVEDDEYYEDTPLTDDEKKEIINVSRGAIILLTLVVILFSIYGGDKSGTKIFTMPDVNFLFPSPLKPQSVLMFKTILQMGVAIVSSIYILFQIPNMVMNIGLSIYACISIIIAYAFLLYYSRLVSVLTYTVTATKEKLKKYIRPFVIACFVVLVLIYYAVIKIGNLSYFEAILKICSFKELEYIPVFGWLSGLIISAINESFSAFIIYLALNIIATICFTLLIWKIPADFYEDALVGANENYETLVAAQTGEKAKRKKERSEKIKKNNELGGEGALVFFTKAAYNRKRFAKFGILTNTAITYSLISLAVTTAFSVMIDFKSAVPIGFIIAVCIFFRNLGNPIALEMDNNFLYTVPEPPFKKLLYCFLAGSYETALDILPAFIIASVSIPEKLSSLILWYIVWLSFDIFCSAVGLFSELVLPSAIVPSIKAMIALSIRMFAIVPGLIMLVAGCATSAPYWFIFTSLLNIGASAVLFAVCPTFLHSGKK